MKPLLHLEDGGVNDPTILAGQVEINQPAEHGIMCNGMSVWIEGRWTDVEGEKDKGTTICFRQEAEVSGIGQGPTWLQPGRQR